MSQITKSSKAPSCLRLALSAGQCWPLWSVDWSGSKLSLLLMSSMILRKMKGRKKKRLRWNVIKGPTERDTRMSVNEQTKWRAS